jgi:prepilin-type N-terminal cleavage/methylation domain-containing protein
MGILLMSQPEQLMQIQFISWRLYMLVFSKNMLLHNTSKTRNIKGFTLLELIVAAAVSLSILSISLGMMTELRRSMIGDRTRITANDNLRQVSDFIGQDLKQAGERLESNNLLPGISIVQGAAGAPSTLVIQRQLLNETLPVCQNISSGTTIDVSVLNGPISGTDYGSAVPNCTYSYKAPTGGELSTTLTTLRPTDNLRSWRTYRCTQTGIAASTADPCASTNSATAWAYIYDPGNKRGEFFQYSGETSGACVSSGFSGLPSTRTCQKIQRVGSAWQYSYTYDPTGAPSSQPQIYLLEERKYSAISDPDTANSYILQLTVNRQTPLRIANNLSNFQAWAKVPTSYTSAPYLAPANWTCDASGSAATAPNPTSPNQWYCPDFNVDLANAYADPILKQQYIKDWQDLQGIRITLSGINPNHQVLKVDTTSANNILKLTSEFFPRNILSKGN